MGQVTSEKKNECLDFVIPLNESHLKMIVKEWGIHYNRGRPHSTLGPGLPEPTQDSVPVSDHRHQLPTVIALKGRPCSGACITNTAWRRRPRKDDSLFAEHSHQGKGNVLLFPSGKIGQNKPKSPVRCRERLGGLLRYYNYAA
jgi:hypothetical protein